MKPVKLALLIVAFLCFVLAIVFDAWRPAAISGGPPVSRPIFLGFGLAFWVLSEILS
jgi:hypothetical protein